jgi:hypothetical protein
LFPTPVTRLVSGQSVNMADSGKAIALGSVALGSLLTWSALNNKGVLDTARNIVRGQKPVPGPASTTVDSNAIENTVNEATGNLGAETNTAAQNQAIARLLAAPYGWSAGSQWDCLVELWNQESGWSNTAENASGAYGIAQALPNSKYPLSGQPPSSGGSASASAQISWGLNYIRETYGTPCGAWSHEESAGWY